MRRKPSGKRTHGESHTRLHNIWCGMNNRCDPSHASSRGYGDRGITVCDDWKSYENFAAWARENGYADELTIERINVNESYCPENCKWIPFKKQARNRRTTHWVKYEGLKMSLAEACERAGLPYKQVFWRMAHAGWTFEKAITTPMGEDKGVRSYEHYCLICGKYFVSPCKRCKYCSHECYLVLRTLRRHGMA